MLYDLCAASTASMLNYIILCYTTLDSNSLSLSLYIYICIYIYMFVYVCVLLH